MVIEAGDCRLLAPDGKRCKGHIDIRGDKYAIESEYKMGEELSQFEGAEWLGRHKTRPEKRWLIPKTPRNDFALTYLLGTNVYTPWKSEVPNDILIRHSRKNRLGEDIKFYEHQCDFVRCMLYRKQVIIAGEMGLGKTLAAFEAMELAHMKEIWYVGPKPAIISVQIEAMVWRCVANIKYMTYDELKTRIKNWVPGTPPPNAVFFDEASRLKNPTSQRSQSAKHLADSMRIAYGRECYIILMTGSPAPKSPLDWWFLCEIACPGFLKEGNILKFKYRLCIIGKKDDGLGGRGYPYLKTWRDGNPNLCDHCGESKTHLRHTEPLHGDYCVFKPLRDEVGGMYRRMHGLVLVKLKKDCLDLPEKVYKQIVLKPSLELMRAAKLITTTSGNAITALTRLRELSDGFQYYEEKVKAGACPLCEGKALEIPCGECMGTGKKFRMERKHKEVSSPKLDALTDLLEDCEDTERCVVYAGFQASIDRICKHVKAKGWEFIRIDGRGWNTSLPGITSQIEMAEYFQKGPLEDNKKVVVVAHPGSAGMGLTLTASQMIIYFSNDFNGESRIQSEDRIHRLGMKDMALIIDLFLLPSDKKVFLNLKEKRELQSLSLGEVMKAMEMTDEQFAIAT